MARIASVSSFVVLIQLLDVASESELCNRLALVTKGKLNISDALRNTTLSVGTGVYSDKMLKDHGNGRFTGFEWDVLQEVRRRAGFELDFNIYKKPEDMPWSDVLYDMRDKYQLVTYGVWLATTERALRGVVTPYGYLDYSYRFVTRQADKDDSFIFMVFQFAQPFDGLVWAFAVVALVVTAFVYLVFEYKNEEDFPHQQVPQFVLADQDLPEDGTLHLSSTSRDLLFKKQEEKPEEKQEEETPSMIVKALKTIKENEGDLWMKATKSIKEKAAKEKEWGKHIIKSVPQAVLKAFYQATGAGGYNPKTWPGRLVLASWSLFIVLFFSAYTANFARFLVEQNTSRTQYNSVEEAMANEALICVERGVIEKWFKSRYKYPHVLYVDQHLNDGSVTAPFVNNKTCQGTIITNFGWDARVKNDKEKNRECKLQLVGEPLQPVIGGWMTDIDYSERCTCVVRDVFNYHFMAMESDGSLNDMRQELFQSPAGCRASEQSTELEKMTLTETLGLFLLHLFGTVLGLTFYTLYHCGHQGFSLTMETWFDKKADQVEQTIVQIKERRLGKKGFAAAGKQVMTLNTATFGGKKIEELNTRPDLTNMEKRSEACVSESAVQDSFQPSLKELAEENLRLREQVAKTVSEQSKGMAIGVPSVKSAAELSISAEPRQMEATRSDRVARSDRVGGHVKKKKVVKQRTQGQEVLEP